MSLCVEYEDTMTMSLLLSLRQQWQDLKYHPDVCLG